jgi:hypothetical protein
MATKTDLTTSYAQVAADVTSLTLIHVPRHLYGEGYVVELVVAADAPESSVYGVPMRGGETMLSANIPDLGSSGKLYARIASYGPFATGSILTV